MKKIIVLTLMFLLAVFQLPARAVSFVEQYAYDAGEADSKLTCRSISLLEIKRLLVEKLGTYIESNTVVTDYRISKDEIVSFGAGVVKTEILDESWDGKTYRLKAQIEADPDAVVRMIEQMKKSGKAVGEVEETNEKYLARISELKEALTRTQKDFIQITRDYQDSSKILSAWDEFETGLKLMREGKFDASIAALSKAIDANPKAMYYFHRGRAYRKIEKIPESLKDFTAAIDMDPGFANAYFARGLTSIKIGKKRRGLKDIRKAAELGSGNAKRWLKMKGK
jgi:tetratricopeptide (TPR) repeat protein